MNTTNNESLLGPISFGPTDIRSNEIELINRVGAGAYGEVWLAKCRGYQVAVKKLFKQKYNQQRIEDFKNEVEAWSRIKHPNVALFMGACTEPGNLCIVGEYYDKGNLEDILTNPEANLSIQKKLLLAKEIAQGMCWLHNTNPVIFHRDLKPSNLLLDRNGHIRVCVKKSKEKLRDTDSIKGTLYYMAPEVLLGKPIDETADIYAFGLVFWQLLHDCDTPFPDMTFKSIADLRHQICYLKYRPSLEHIADNGIIDLLTRCWHPSPEQRPPFREICSLIDSILVNVSIKDPLAATFWKEKFLASETVEFSDFQNQFEKYFKIDISPVQLNCLQLTIGSEVNDGIMGRRDIVSIDKFGKFLENFGPLYKTTARLGRSKKKRTITAFNRLYLVCRNDWYYGDLDRNKCASMLQHGKIGDYLIRFSSTIPGCFTLSYITTSLVIKHHRIEYDCINGKYTTKTSKGLASSDSLAIIISKHLTPEFSLCKAFGVSPFHAVINNPAVDESGFYDECEIDTSEICDDIIPEVGKN